MKKCKDCGACNKGFFKSRPNDYVCIGVKEPFVITDINSYCTEYPEDKIKDEDISGVELQFSIRFNPNDNREYLHKVTELQDKITDSIEELGHNFVIGTGKPILKTELEDE